MSKFQLSFLVGLISAFNACVNLPAIALPGQKAEEVMQWSDRHPLISGLHLSIKLQGAEPELMSSSKCHGNELSFAVWAPKGLVIRELIDYRSNDTSLNFAPENSAGINLIRQVYDSAIAQDFASSTLIYHTKDKPSFYQGRRYAYITRHFRDLRREDKTQQPTVSQLEVVPLNQLKKEIQNDQYTGNY